MKRGRHSVAAKFIRTFLMAASAGVVSLQGIDFFTNWRSGVSQIGVVLIGAVLAGALAALLAATPANPTTPGTKAVAQFVQHFTGQLAGFQLIELTGDALLNLGHQLGRAAISAALSAIAAYLTNVAEGPPAD